MATAAAAPATAQVIQAPIEKVRIWKKHQRTTWDVPGQTLAQLGDSIVGEGQTTAAKARMVDGFFELIDGARRFKACVLKGVTFLLVIVEDDVDDLEMVKRQIIDNSGVPLHPIDEAALFEQMAKLHGMTIDAIADETGFDVDQVKRRLKLCSLTKATREHYVAGAIDDEIAYAASRVQAAAAQEREIAAYVKGDRRRDDTLRNLRKLATRSLGLVPWQLNDETFPLDKVRAPTCSVCPERTLAQLPLFGDLYKPDEDGEIDAEKAQDFCTNPGCFDVKLKISAQRAIDEAKKQKIPVLSKAESAKLFDSHESWRAELRGVQWRGAYVDADSKTNEYGNAEKAYRVVMKDAPAHALAIDPDGFPRWLYKRKEAEDAKNTASRAEARAQRKAPKKKSAADKREETKQKAKREKSRLFDLVEARLVSAAVEKAATTDSNRLLTVLAHLALDAFDYKLDTIAKTRGVKVGDLKKQADKGPAGARSLLVELLFWNAADHDYSNTGKVERFAKMLHVDPRVARAQAIKADQAEREAAKVKAKAAKKK